MLWLLFGRSLYMLVLKFQRSPNDSGSTLGPVGLRFDTINGHACLGPSRGHCMPSIADAHRPRIAASSGKKPCRWCHSGSNLHVVVARNPSQPQKVAVMDTAAHK